eukprot:TRINITY_DN35542_c0_g1_i1.p1 TRINITY_DN35542_c0_g1~~TRINITY_DN35542_c0_g1_i1.p1  ORF type:complete len:579 (+),score=142.50 TRINITY_DN35542_c0_g1_i1:74-1810(+)
MAKKKKGGVVLKTPGAGGTKSGGTPAPVAEAKPDEAAPETELPTEASPRAPAPAQGGRKKKRRRVSSGAAAAAEANDDDEDDANEGAGASAASSVIAAGNENGSCPTKPWSSPASRTEAQAALAWLVWPLSPQTFLTEYWEKKPLHLKRNRRDYYEGLFSKAELDRKMKDGMEARYGERINLARFDDKTGKKIDLNKGERGTPAKIAEVKEAWASGATMQVMHPQQFHEPVRATLTSLERSFGSVFGANCYLTPNKSQGLAPHFDDVEVFMLQLEGSKRWRLNEPPDGEEYPLPRDYSRDFLPSEIGTQLVDCILETGDLLYLPRGTVHQGVAQASTSSSSTASADFSHHLTVSAYQRNAWCNLLEKALSGALERAAGESSEFREGLPVNYLSYMGSWHDLGNPGEEGQHKGSKREAFIRHVKGLISRLQEFVELDEVCDELSVDFMAQRLPPVRSENQEKQEQAEVTLDSRVRWVDASAVRPVLSQEPETGEATVVIFHSCANQCDLHMCKDVEAEEEIGTLRYEASIFLPGLRALCSLGEATIRCGDLPLKDEDDRVALIENLMEAGLLEFAPGQQ